MAIPNQEPAGDAVLDKTRTWITAQVIGRVRRAAAAIGKAGTAVERAVRTWITAQVIGWVRRAAAAMGKAGTATGRAVRNLFDSIRSTTERRGSDALARRPVRFLGGVLVAALPAYFTFVPPDPNAAVWPVRALLITVWLLLLIFAVFIASAHDISIDRLAAWARGTRTDSRKKAAYDILRRILPPLDDVAKDYVWTLYVPDELDRGLLVPVPLISVPSATQWRVGTGVTGTAYAKKEFQVGRGRDLKPGGQFAPQPGQSPHLQDYRTVVAQPVLNASHEVIAVLAAATTTGRRRLLNEDGRSLLERLANDISRILIDILGFEE